MYRWCSVTIRIIVTCKGLGTGDNRETSGGCVHSRAFLARNRDLEQAIAISPAVCHCSQFTCMIVW